MLIVWNRTDYLYENRFGKKNTYKGWYAIRTNHQPTNQSMNKTNIAKGVANKNHCLQLFNGDSSYVPEDC